MISQRIRGLNSFFLLAQSTLVLLVYWLTFLLIDLLHAPMPATQRYELYCIIIYAALLVESLRQLNRATNRLPKNWVNDHRTALRQTLLVTVVLVIFVVMTKDQAISRAFLLTFLPAMYLTLLGSARLLPRWLAQLTFRGLRQERTLLIGPVAKAESLKRWLDHKADFGITTIGLLSDEEGAGNAGGLRCLGDTDDLERVVGHLAVTQVVLVELPMFPHVLQSLTNLCEQLGVRLLVRSDLESRFRHPVTYFEEDGLHFIGLREEPLENPVNRFLKRTLDIVVSLPVILFILPVTSVIVAFFQRRQSPGPLLHRQDRAGHQRRQFQILKYRTMHANTLRTRQATVGDTRIFPAARVFRRFGIDELPQFWNVLRGEMSVVGPRPHLLEHNQEFASLMSSYHIRALVKPGITGLAQVRGYRGEMRSQEDLIERIKLDIHYLENWSLLADLVIIAQTAWQMIFPPKSAY